MSHDTDALYGFAAQGPRRFSSPQIIPKRSGALPQSVLGGIGLAFVATACAWTIWSHLAGGEVLTVEARFGGLPSGTAPRVASASVTVQKRHAGYFDARHFSQSRTTFSGGTASTLAGHFAPAATSGAPGLQEAAALARPPVRELARSVPLPAPRPTQLASQQGEAASPPVPSAPKALIEDKATVLALISSSRNSVFNKLFGKPKPEATTLAYASPDGGFAGDTRTILFDGMPKYDQWTAVYDIGARTVYLPDGTELEAHSGLGKRMDDPRQAHVKMHGATPPHVYDLSMRERLFHGDEALRLTPVGGDDRIFGRKGLLTHSYLLGPRGDSNGCVSFKDYGTFVQAFKRGQIKRMVVVARLG